MRKPPITERVRRIQLKWAEEHINWTMEQWYNILWTDETWVTAGHHMRTWVTQKVEKNGIQRVLLNDINGKKDGCFGAVFTVKHKGLVYFGKRIGVPSIDILIVLTRYQ